MKSEPNKSTIKKESIVEEELLQLKESEKLKDEFISVASHELKTPVTTLKVYLHIIEDHFKKTGDEQHSQFAVKAANQVEKLSKIINDLLDMSKINSHEFEYEDALFEYTDFIKKVIKKFQTKIKSHKIELTGNCNALINGDKKHLSTAIENLLNNAVKYSANNNKIIVHIADSENKVQTSVTDYGTGISEKNYKKIFKKFFRVKENHQQTFPGLGIGLYITSEIVTRHGGNIFVKSEEGKETCFTFTLPIYSEK